MLTDFEILMIVLNANAYSYAINVVANMTLVTVVDEGEPFSTELQEEYGIAFSNNGECMAVGLIKREFDYWLSLYGNGGVAL